MVALPAAKASFIMPPMPASPPGALPYQPGAPPGKPEIWQNLANTPDFALGLLETGVGGAAPLGGPVRVDHVVQDGDPKTILPEPATIAVLGVGLLSLAFLRRAGA